MNKLVIATPVYGKIESASVSWGYHVATCRLLRDPAIDFLDGRTFVNCDLVRARSRAVRMFLQTDGTHLLFWDEDVVPSDLSAISLMMNSGKDFVALPYPRKKIVWDAAADALPDENEMAVRGRMTGPEIEGSATEWPHGGHVSSEQDGGMMRVERVGMGFTMITRGALEKMIERHPELAFVDSIDGAEHKTTALFQLMLTGRDLLSEDFSFCRRWRDLGGDIWIVLDPAAHVGAHVFGGHLHG